MHMRSKVGVALAIGLLGATALLGNAGQSGAAIVLGIAALIGLSLSIVRAWLTRLEEHLTDATAERKRLADKLAQCEVAHLSALSAREKYRIETAVIAARYEQRLADATAAIRQEFEDVRALELAQSYVEGAMNERGKRHRQEPHVGRQLIYLADRRRPSADGATAN